MLIIIPESNYTFDSSLKEITLSSPYDAVEEGMINEILDLSTSERLYSRDLLDEPISISAGVITHTHSSSSSSQTDSDKLAILVEVGVSSGIPINVISKEGDLKTADDYESLGVADSAVGLTAGTYGTNSKCEMTLEGGSIRVRKDGTDPTSGEGHLVNVGDVIKLGNNDDIVDFRAIRVGSVSGVLKCTYSV
ncbi:MAG: hypothetical protein KAS66_08065 [Candidatus Omnitrophica bacterium]|nr:hypothetical protein [Candidatus Omnitrophota bacterium]